MIMFGGSKKAAGALEGLASNDLQTLLLRVAGVPLAQCHLLLPM